MNAQEDMTHPSVAGSGDQLELARLKWLVSRYDVVVGVFAHSLTDEFLPCEEALRDWTNNLSLLREASFPIRDFLHKHVAQSESPEHYAFLQRTDTLVKQAIRVLIDRKLDDEPVGETARDVVTITAADLLAQANMKLRGAITVLREWQTRFAEFHECQPETVDYSVPQRAVVERLLDRQELRLLSFTKSNDKSDAHVHAQCMASRKLYLLSHFAATVYPDMWTDERRQRLLRAQDNLIEKMSDGSPSRQSVLHRRDEIQSSPVLNPALTSTGPSS
ncbi:MAG: hypothetical protein KDA96_11100 [Planctomycetaceae bacterium]|nr:hypothetical protein [Planctomycetaceae bacterium]